MVERLALIGLFALCGTRLMAAACEGATAWLPCEFVFELSGSEAVAHPNPYADVDLNMELRSPRFRTFRMPAYWAGGRKLVVRFTPTEGGQWTYRITSNLASVEGKQGTFNAAESDAPGFIRPANVHHWITEDKKAHLWMGYVLDRFAWLPAAEFERQVGLIAASKFNHIRGDILGGTAESHQAYGANGLPNEGYFEEFDRRILAVHQKRITTDLVLAASPEVITKLFPDWQTRKLFLRYIVGRYAAFNTTWQGLEEFEGYYDGRPLLKELGLALKELDAYQHPRSSCAKMTSAPLLPDGWMSFVVQRSLSDTDDAIGAVEHQLYTVPFVGVTTAQRIWSSTMNGQYPEVQGPFAKEPQVWFDLISDSRHWELEPYFDVDAARAVALEDVEYLVYVQKTGPLEVTVEKHGYDVSWVNPLTGESLPQKKKYKGEHFTGEAPDGSHPWVLIIEREGRKESMLKSYRFDSRPIPIQELEQSAQKVPFEVIEPAGETLSASGTIRFAVKLKKETRATRSMQYLWTGEVSVEGQGYRVLATGAQGTFRVPTDIVKKLPAVFTVRVSALNANGKAYSADKVYELRQ